MMETPSDFYYDCFSSNAMNCSAEKRNVWRLYFSFMLKHTSQITLTGLSSVTAHSSPDVKVYNTGK